MLNSGLSGTKYRPLHMLGELMKAESWLGGGGGGLLGLPLTPTLPPPAGMARNSSEQCQEGGALEISCLVYLFVTGVCQGSFFDFLGTQGQVQIKEASLCLHLTCFLSCRLQSGVLLSS